MSVSRPSALRPLLARHDVRPSRTLGQNFLIDGNVRDRILDAAELRPGDAALEIGPGAGALTEGLLARGVRVTAVEKDRRLCALLDGRFAGEPNLRLLHGDALEIGLDALLADGLRVVVSNLPYSAGTRILVDLIHAPHAPERIVVTLQTEVAERLAARPDTAPYGLLAVWAQRLYDVERLRTVPPECFWPVPEVESAVLRLVRRAQPLAPVRDLKHYLFVTRYAFSQRRKQLQRILRGLPGGGPDAPAAWLAQRGFAPAARPGNLDPAAWARLAEALPPSPGGAGA